MMQNLFGENEWVGEGTLKMNVLDKSATIWLKLKSFHTGEIAAQIRADILGDPIDSTYTRNKDEPSVIYLNSSLIGSIEGKMYTENDFIGIEYGNEVLGYAGFEAFSFTSKETFSYEGKFINCLGETCDIEANCMLHELCLRGGE